MMEGVTGPVRTTTAEALLGLLSLKPMSGYELRQMIADSIGNFWSESYGQIYPTLKKLEREGLIEGSEGDRAGSTRYTLTDLGRGRLGRWLATPPRPPVPRNEALLKLFFGDRLPVSLVIRQIRSQRSETLTEIDRYLAIERDVQQGNPGRSGLPFWLMTVRYGLAEARARIAWYDETLQALAALHTAPKRTKR